MNKILLVDGMALLFRGFFATSFRGNFMITSKGIPTNGVFQFLKYFLDAIHKLQPTHVICCWDMGSKTFRTDLYSKYKANRQAPPEELIPQFDLVKEVVDTFNIPNIGLENYEADDCIGTLAKQYEKNNEVLILTGDLDLLQLVSEQVKVIIMRKGQGNYEEFNKENFFDKRGIKPEQVIDLKAFTGDSADNYPGVKGIGEKTALKLLNEYQTVENVLGHIEKLTTGQRNKIEENIEMLHLSKQLAAIKCDTPVTCDLDGSKWAYDKHTVMEKCKELEFKNVEQLLITL